jgi:hypothetical protein
MGELIGANVLVKGTTIGNVTDMNGSVTLQDVPANAVLEISYIGYTTKEVPVGSQSVINVTLSEDSQALEEVVVVEASDQLRYLIVCRRYDEGCGWCRYHQLFAR